MKIENKLEGKVWEKAEVYSVYLDAPNLQLHGDRLLWVVIGRKWVRLATLLGTHKMKININTWDKIDKEKYHE